MLSTQTEMTGGDILQSLLSDENFRPPEPQSIEETGVNEVFIETLLGKYLVQAGAASGRSIADRLCLPFPILEGLLKSLRSRQFIVHRGEAPLNDYYYALTQQGSEWTKTCSEACSYVGPIPVPLEDYLLSVEAQSIRNEAIRRQQLEEAFSDISVEQDLFESLGPAVNSSAGLFLYGAPGNGKTTMAQRIIRCFGQSIWIPHALIEDGEIIKFYDASVHEPIEQTSSSLMTTSHDRRWLKIHRPTVVVGGELTMDSLEIRHNSNLNVSEAPLQLKSNCGCLLIDDFGRQRIDPTALLNRWIVPLENRCDYLTLGTGKKIRVPFDQLIIFSTNLEPEDLADEAFLRRIPYKVEVRDPDEAEFHKLFKLAGSRLGLAYKPEAVEYLIGTHYRPVARPFRKCHPRDLLSQIKNYCRYQGRAVELLPEYLDLAVKNYFTVVTSKST